MMSRTAPNVEEEHPSSEAPAPAAPPAHGFSLRRLARFASIVSAILLTANAVVCGTAAWFFGLPAWQLWQIGPGLVALAFIPATLLRFRSAHPVLRLVYAVSASWLGALNFAFFAALACWIALGIASLLRFPLPRVPVAGLLFGLAFLVTVCGLVNARWLRITRVTIRLPGMPEAWQGRTAALVTDLHLGPLSGAAFLRRVIARLRLVQPDAVFISGDMFDGPAFGLDRMVAPWREFAPPRGIFYVTGNHDEFGERQVFIEAARRTGIRVLHNEMVSLDGLQLVGVHDSEAGDPVELRAILRRARIDPLRPSILLAHRPINLAVAEEEGISLQLSGHTHRGQIWPWSVLVSRIYGRFAYGLHRLDRLWVYTSSGAGTWGPPLRVGTRSEIVLIRFENEAE